MRVCLGRFDPKNVRVAIAQAVFSMPQSAVNDAAAAERSQSDRRMHVEADADGCCVLTVPRLAYVKATEPPWVAHLVWAITEAVRADFPQETDDDPRPRRKLEEDATYRALLALTDIRAAHEARVPRQKAALRALRDARLDLEFLPPDAVRLFALLTRRGGATNAPNVRELVTTRNVVIEHDAAARAARLAASPETRAACEQVALEAVRRSQRFAERASFEPGDALFVAKTRLLATQDLAAGAFLLELRGRYTAGTRTTDAADELRALEWLSLPAASDFMGAVLDLVGYACPVHAVRSLEVSQSDCGVNCCVRWVSGAVPFLVTKREIRAGEELVAFAA